MATTAELLADARTARHNLITGKLARVFMDQNGERVEFTTTNLASLDRYIRELEGLLAPDIALTRMRRPIGFTF